jgi:hypothetical protein
MRTDGMSLMSQAGPGSGGRFSHPRLKGYLRFRDAGELPPLAVSQCSEAGATMARFHSLLVPMVGSGVSWENDRVPWHHTLKACECLHLTHHMCTGIDKAAKV